MRSLGSRLRRFSSGNGSTGRPPETADSPRSPLFSIAIAIGVGLLVLADLLLQVPLLDAIGARLVDYALIIGATALILGALNVLSLHSQRVETRRPGWLYSLILLLVTLGLIAVGLVTGPQQGAVAWSFQHLFVPLEAAFFALLAFFIIQVAARLLAPPSPDRLLFAVGALVVLTGTLPLGGGIGQWLGALKGWLLAVPVTAGSRALLIGIALGTIGTGVRLIFDGRRYFK